MRELAEDNEKNDRARNPTPSLVGVHNLVPKASDEEGGGRDDENAGPAGHVAVYCGEQLGANDDIDGGPADAG